MQPLRRCSFLTSALLPAAKGALIALSKPPATLAICWLAWCCPRCLGCPLSTHLLRLLRPPSTGVPCILWAPLLWNACSRKLSDCKLVVGMFLRACHRMGHGYPKGLFLPSSSAADLHLWLSMNRELPPSVLGAQALLRKAMRSRGVSWALLRVFCAPQPRHTRPGVIPPPRWFMFLENAVVNLQASCAVFACLQAR
jgi:hypothetical protein